MRGVLRRVLLMVSSILATLLVAVSSSTTDAVARVHARSVVISQPVVTSAAEAERLLGTTPPVDDIAMTDAVDTPCTAPCWRTGLVYERTGSALDPDGGVKPYALDLFRSARTPAKDAPVVVVMHGGGFVTGGRSDMRPVSEALANAGFLVATIDYRLVPESRNGGIGIVSDKDLIPASGEAEADAERAIRWIHAHRATLGAAKDRRRYAVGGYSAGAIAAMRVAIRGGDPGTPAARRWRVGAGFAISGAECGSWSKAYRCRPAYDRKDPPVQMFHGEADSIVPLSWGQQTCASAVLSGGGCRAFYYPQQDHFWPNGTIFGGGDGLTKRHPAVLPTIAKFLRRELVATKR